MEWSQFGMKWPVWNGEPVWDELTEMAPFHGNPRQNNPVDEMSPFHPPALMPAGHKNRQALHRTGFGLKMMKKQPLPCQTCAAKAPPVLTPGGHKNRQAPRPPPGPCKMIPRYAGPTELTWTYLGPASQKPTKSNIRATWHNKPAR